MESLHFFFRVYGTLRKQTSVKVLVVLQSMLVRRNVLTNLNTVNLMLPRLLKWGVKLKPEQLIWYLFWPVSEKSIRDGVTGSENSRATLYFSFKSTKQSTGPDE